MANIPPQKRYNIIVSKYVCESPRFIYIDLKSLDEQEMIYTNTKYLGAKPIYRQAHPTGLFTDYYANSIVGCGRCLACKLKKSGEWVFRLQLESQYFTNKWFLTLTYDNENVPKKDGVNNLEPSDISKLIRKMRDYLRYKKIDQKIKYFVAGEYGPLTKRPHYHLILFGFPFNDIQPLTYGIHPKTEQSIISYKSELMRKFWPKGWHLIQKASTGAMAYVSRYSTKKIFQSKKDKLYIQGNRLNDEYLAMSLKPAIAYQYVIDNYKKIYKDDRVYLRMDDRVFSLVPPRYFDKVLSRIDKYYYLDVKKKRSQMSINRSKLILDDLSNYYNYLETNKRQLEKSTTFLKLRGKLQKK